MLLTPRSASSLLRTTSLTSRYFTRMSSSVPPFDPKDMPFRNLGPSGLRVPVFSLGGWLTLGGSVKGDPVKDIMVAAYDNGINMFDTAEGYAEGNSEVEMGRVIKEMGWHRSDLIVSTKIFFGTGRKEPNSRGLSRKHIIEGANASLKRAGLDYFDVIFAHRHDATVPMEEIVRSFNYLIDHGLCHYWGTSEWPASRIEEAYHEAARLNLIAPIAEQPHYSMFCRDRFEVEYEPLQTKYKYGSTIWSPLDSGMLTGKYNDVAESGEVPEGSRYAGNKEFFKDTIEKLKSPEGKAQIAKVKELTKVAEELGVSMATLALAWAGSNPNVSTVILGASKPEQVLENIKAVPWVKKIQDDKDLKAKLDKILDNTPKATPTFGR